MPFASIPEAVEEFRAGRLLVVVDDEDRENEGDLTVAAESITPEIVNFMATHGRGLICLALSPDICDTLGLPLMSSTNTSRFGTAFCESIEAREGVTTGISAKDRALTIRVAMDPKSRAGDLARPGHVFPLRAREGGVLVRAGQTEAAVDLARMAGLRPGGVICEVMNPDGSMARVPELKEFCLQHRIKMITVAELIRHRLRHEKFVRREGEGKLQTAFGEFRAIYYSSAIDDERHLVLIRGDLNPESVTLVRMHAHCSLGDIFGSAECECQQTLRSAMGRIGRDGGVVVYLHLSGSQLRVSREDGKREILPHGREPLGSGKLLQHEVGIGAQILCDLGLTQIRLLTNHPRRAVGLEGFGIQIVGSDPVT